MTFLPLDEPAGRRAVQLVVTLGPASFDRAPELAEAGATAFRLNASHLTPAALRGAVELVRRELPLWPLVVDLQGAKMRLGVFVERTIVAGETLSFAVDPASAEEIPLPHAELFAAVRAGDRFGCDDDRLCFRVKEVGEQRLRAVALAPGDLRARKGVNLFDHPLELVDLGAADVEALEALEGKSGLAWAFSFMKDGTEVDWVRRRQPGALIVGKVERAEAVEGLDSIASLVDAVWICRGDLGAQLGLAALARTVASLDPRRYSRPMLMAGQVLEHLTRHPEPTRSEVCHLHDLLARGYAGVVLSDETAIGDDPVGAVRVAHRLIHDLWPGL